MIKSPKNEKMFYKKYIEMKKDNTLFSNIMRFFVVENAQLQ